MNEEKRDNMNRLHAKGDRAQSRFRSPNDSRQDLEQSSPQYTAHSNKLSKKGQQGTQNPLSEQVQHDNPDLIAIVHKCMLIRVIPRDFAEIGNNRQ
jgi:hypothetical protein